MSTLPTLSQRLIAATVKADAAELLAVRMELAPGGKINAAAICKPGSAISVVAGKIGAAATINTIFAIIKNFCSRVNIARNLSEFQMIDVAEVLFADAPKNYTLEDYLVAFDLAAKGLIKPNNGRGLIDRLDLAIINEILTKYDEMRYEAAEEAQQKAYSSGAADPEYQKAMKKLKDEMHEGETPAVTEKEIQAFTNQFLADYKAGKTGYKPGPEEVEEAKKKRVEAKKEFFNQKNKE